MDEQQVRALVRQAIARHLGSAPAPAESALPAAPPRPAWPVASSPSASLDASHARFHLIRPAGEIECLIEPSVPCNHCGYCQCYGH